MIKQRITDPKTLSEHDIKSIIATGRSAIIQFSRNCYTPEILEHLNEYCKKYGSDIEVRFFGYHFEVFDASVLQQVPNVRSLSVDCSTNIRNSRKIWKLPFLERLTFGIYEFDDPEFLDGLPLEQLTHLSIHENRKRNIDLAPIQRCGKLRDLFVQGHTKNIDKISNASLIETVWLHSIPKRQTLAFINEMHNLKYLKISLGGRLSIDELHHSSLSELCITRIRGLETLGDVKRFPSLQKLHIQDQIKLETLSLSGVSLHELQLHNCKNFHEIDGLTEQNELGTLRIRATNLELEALANANWPPSLKVFSMSSGSNKENKALRQKLDALGFLNFDLSH